MPKIYLPQYDVTINAPDDKPLDQIQAEIEAKKPEIEAYASQRMGVSPEQFQQAQGAAFGQQKIPLAEGPDYNLPARIARTPVVGPMITESGKALERGFRQTASTIGGAGVEAAGGAFATMTQGLRDIGLEQPLGAPISNPLEGQSQVARQTFQPDLPRLQPSQRMQDTTYTGALSEIATGEGPSGGRGQAAVDFGTKLVSDTLGIAPSMAATVAGFLMAGPAGAGAMGGFLEGASQYEKAKAEGKSEQKALQELTTVGVGTGVLNAIPFIKAFDKVLPDQLKGYAANFLLRGAVEGATETAEGALPPLAELERVPRTTKEATDLLVNMGAGIYDESGVFLPAMITGGLMGGGATAPRSTAAEQAPSNIGQYFARRGTQTLTPPVSGVDVLGPQLQTLRRPQGPIAQPEIKETQVPPVAPEPQIVDLGEAQVRQTPKKLQRFETLFDEAAAQTQGAVWPELLIAQAQVESGGNPKAVSPKGAQGLMQFMPPTAKEMGITDPFDPRQSVMGAARFMQDALEKSGGDLDVALAIYNAGYGNVQKYGGVPPFKETQEYIRKVRSAMAAIQGDTVTASLLRTPPDKLQQIVDTRVNKGKPVTAKEVKEIIGEGDKESVKPVRDWVNQQVEALPQVEEVAPLPELPAAAAPVAQPAPQPQQEGGESYGMRQEAQGRQGEVTQAQQAGGVQVPPPAKQPWEMTRKEFGKEFLFHGTHAPESVRSEGFLEGTIFASTPDLAKNFGDKSSPLFVVRGSDITDTPAKDIDPIGQEWINLGVARRSSTKVKPVAEVSRGSINPHRDIVASALREGKPVPASVLADYPDLAAKYQQPSARTSALQTAAQNLAAIEGKAEPVVSEGQSRAFERLVGEKPKGQVAIVAGQTYELVSENGNGTITVRNQQGDVFDTDPGEPYSLRELPPKKAEPTTRKEFIDQALAEHSQQQRDAVRRAMLGLRSAFPLKGNLPTGISHEQWALTEKARTKDQKQAQFKYRQAMEFSRTRLEDDPQRWKGLQIAADRKFGAAQVSPQSDSPSPGIPSEPQATPQPSERPPLTFRRVKVGKKNAYDTTVSGRTVTIDRTAAEPGLPFEVRVEGQSAPVDFFRTLGDAKAYVSDTLRQEMESEAQGDVDQANVTGNTAESTPSNIPPVVRDAIFRVHAGTAEQILQRMRPYADRGDYQPLYDSMYEKAKALAESKGWDWEAIVDRVRIDKGRDQNWMDERQANEFKSYEDMRKSRELLNKKAEDFASEALEIRQKPIREAEAARQEKESIKKAEMLKQKEQEKEQKASIIARVAQEVATIKSFEGISAIELWSNAKSKAAKDRVVSSIISAYLERGNYSPPTKDDIAEALNSLTTRPVVKQDLTAETQRIEQVSDAWISETLNSVPEGAPGISVETAGGGLNSEGLLIPPQQLVVFRDSKGKVVTVAKLKDTEDGGLAVDAFVTDKTRGITGAKGAALVGEELVKIGATQATGMVSNDAQRFIEKMSSKYAQPTPEESSVAATRPEPSANIPNYDGPISKQYSIEATRKNAKPMLDPKGKPTGWRAIQAENGTILIHPTENRTVAFVHEGDQSKASLIRRKRMLAQAFAMDNPIEAKVSPAPETQGELVTKPVFQPSGETGQLAASSQPKTEYEEFLEKHQKARDEAAKYREEQNRIEAANKEEKAKAEAERIARLESRAAQLAPELASQPRPIWKMPFKQYAKERMANENLIDPRDIAEREQELRRVHRRAVQDAIAAGEKVPVANVKEYGVAEATAAPAKAEGQPKQPWEMTETEYKQRGTRTHPDGADAQQNAFNAMDALQKARRELLQLAGTEFKDRGYEKALKSTKPGTGEARRKLKELQETYDSAVREASKYESHKYHVEQAIAQGKPVPPEVLAEYPDLQARFSTPAKPAPAVGKQPTTPTSATILSDLRDQAREEGLNPIEQKKRNDRLRQAFDEQYPGSGGKAFSDFMRTGNPPKKPKRGADPTNPQAGVINLDAPKAAWDALYDFGFRQLVGPFTASRPGARAEAAAFERARVAQEGSSNRDALIKKRLAKSFAASLRSFSRNRNDQRVLRDAIDGLKNGTYRMAPAPKGATKETILQSARDVISGKSNVLLLPERLQKSAQAQREFLDAASQYLLENEIATTEGQKAAVKKGIGLWLRRSYEVHDNPNWLSEVQGKPVWNAALDAMQAEWTEATQTPESLTDLELIQFGRRHLPGVKNAKALNEIEKVLAENPTADTLPADSRAQIESALRELPQRSRAEFSNRLTSILAEMAQEGREGVLSNRLGSQNRTSLMRRKTIPKWMRDVMGEYTEPEINFARSAEIQAQMIAAWEFSKSLYEAGKGTFIFDNIESIPDNLRAAFDRGEFRQVPDNAKYGMLAGKYMSKELREALDQKRPEYDLPLRVLSQISGSVRWMKTIGNVPSGYIRNFFSSMFAAASRGDVPIATMAKVASGIRAGKGFDRSMAEAIGIPADNSYSMYKKLQDHHEKMVKLGVHDTDPTANLVRERLRNGLFGKGEFDPNNPHVLRKINELATNSWLAGDNFWKSISFMENVNRYESYAKKQGWTQEQLERHAADVVRATSPTYDAAFPIVNKLKNSSINMVWQDFMTWPAERIRNKANLLKLIGWEMKSGDKALQASAAGRLVTMISSHAIMTIALGTLGQWALGGDDEDEDWAVRSLLPEWMRYAPIYHFGKTDKGEYGVLDLGFSDPDSMMNKVLLAAYEGNYDDAAMELINTFFGTSIAYDTFEQIRMNRKRSGLPVFFEHDDTWKKFIKGVKFASVEAGPPLLALAWQAYERTQGKKEEIGTRTIGDRLWSFTGFSNWTIDPERSFGFKAHKAASHFRDIRRDISNEATEYPNRNIREIEKDRATTRDKYAQDLVEFGVAAKIAGVSTANIRKQLKEASIREDYITKIMQGINRSYDNMKKTGVRDFSVQLPTGDKAKGGGGLFETLKPMEIMKPLTIPGL